MVDNFQGSRMFGMVPIGALRDKEILNSKKALPLLIEIVSMLNVTGKFYMSNNTLAKRLYCSKQTINNCLNLLERKGLIKRETIYEEDTNQKRRLITEGPELGKAFLIGWSNGIDRGSQINLTTPSQTNLTRVVKPTCLKKNNIKEQYKRTKESLSSKRDERDFINPNVQKSLDLIAEKFTQAKKPLSSKAANKLIKVLEKLDLDDKDSARKLEKVTDIALQKADYPFGYLLKCLEDLDSVNLNPQFQEPAKQVTGVDWDNYQPKSESNVPKMSQEEIDAVFRKYGADKD